MKLGNILALIMATVFAWVPFGSAQAQGGIEIGVLTCSVVPGSRVNLLIRSTADVNWEPPPNLHTYFVMAQFMRPS